MTYMFRETVKLCVNIFLFNIYSCSITCFTMVPFHGSLITQNLLIDSASSLCILQNNERLDFNQSNSMNSVI